MPLEVTETIDCWLSCGPWPYLAAFLAATWLGWFLWLIRVPAAHWQQVVPLFSIPLILIATGGIHWCSFSTSYYRNAIPNGGAPGELPGVFEGAAAYARGALHIHLIAACEIFGASLMILFNYRKFSQPRQGL